MTTDTTLAELHAKRGRLVGELTAIGIKADTTAGDLERVARLEAGCDRIDREIATAEEVLRDEMRQAVVAGTVRLEAGSDGGHDVGTYGGDEYERGRRNIDAAVRAGQLPDHAADKAHRLLEAGSTGERSLSARWAAAAGDEHYRSAFAKLLADPDRGHLLWTGPEADAYRTAAAVNVELQRAAMSTTGANGGYMIPLTLDPAIMLTSDGSNNPLRRLARVVQTSTNAWAGVTSAGATSEWKAEAAEVADGSPTVAQPSIPVHFGDSFLSYSFEVGMDAVDFLGELTTVLIDSADNLQATAFTTGNGSTAPQGIVTGLAGTSSEINGTGSEAIVAADAYALQNALPARFSGNATWQSHIATANTFRQLETTNGALAFPELRQSPPMLAGKAWHENSNMDGSINAAATANNYALIYGDIRQAFVIVDRIGSTLELVPNLFHTTTNRPSGQRGALLWFRTGSEVVNIAAARLLDIPTTA